MTLSEIKRLRIRQIAALPCALFLWATWPNIKMAFEVIDAWGFEYKTIAWVWLKTVKDGSKFAMGTGNYTRANSEPCLLAFRKTVTRGKIMNVGDHAVPSWIVSTRRKHSQKPDLQYEYIERLYPNLPKIELFARQAWPGWDVWGDGIKDSIEWQK
jgi:site-specific DNA-methyltransferase (adenine-specific)